MRSTQYQSKRTHLLNMMPKINKKEIVCPRLCLCDWRCHVKDPKLKHCNVHLERITQMLGLLVH
jgi:hypothetical protein